MTEPWEYDPSSITVDLPPATKATPEQEARFKPRGAWERFMDALNLAAVHNPIGAEVGIRDVLRKKGYNEDQINTLEKNYIAQLNAKQARDPAFQGKAKLTPSNIGRGAVDLAGSLVGGIDPTYVLGPGKNALARILAQGGINAGQDAIAQYIEKRRGVRDEYDPAELALNATVGAVVQGGQEVGRAARTGVSIRRGSAMPGYEEVNNVILGLEGGGSLEHPKVSPKGAVGPQQVMMATARKPGFGIRPWDGKTQADLARVGRQYSAVMMDRYDGDTAKVLAAYNAGPGTVDKLVAKYGNDWRAHLPGETKAYVRNGLNKLAPTQGPDNLGPIELAQNKLPAALDMARANDALSPEEDAMRQDILNKAQDSDNVLEFPESDNKFIERVMHPDHNMTPDEENRLDGLLATTTPEEIERTRKFITDLPDDVKQNISNILTPGERQELDASVENYGRPPEAVDARTVGQGADFPQPIPANDPRRPFIQLIKDLWNDEGGALRDGPNEPGDPTEEKLIAALRAARPVSAEQRKAYRQERALRAGQLDKLQQEGGGRENYYKQLKVLQGKLPKVDYESIAEQFTEEDIAKLANRINFSNSLLPLEKTKALTALHNLLGAEGAKVPTAGEIKLLSEVFSKNFVEAMLDNRTLMQKVWHNTKSALNIPRALMASYDLSAPFRQGIGFVGKKEFWKSVIPMFQAFASEKNSKALQMEIKSRPTWELMKRGGLAIVDPHSHYLADREEAFMTDLAEKIPVVGRGVNASNRAYSGFLNKLRADVFDDFVRQYENLGINLSTDTKKLREIARFINSATGRGDLGKLGNPAAPALAGVFFSPRLIAARLYMLSPHIYMKKDPILRKEAWKSLLSISALALTTAGLAKYGLGMDVEDDPRSADFMKPKVGNTRYDFLGGFQQYIRLGAQLITGETKNAKGKMKSLTSGDFGQPTRRDVAVQFGLNKLAPIPAFISDWLEGKDATGKKFKMTDELANHLIPLAIQDMTDAYKEWGMAGIPMAAPSIFGVGVQTYKPRPSKQKAKKEDFEYGASDSKPRKQSNAWEY